MYPLWSLYKLIKINDESLVFSEYLSIYFVNRTLVDSDTERLIQLVITLVFYYTN